MSSVRQVDGVDRRLDRGAPRPTAGRPTPSSPDGSACPPRRSTSGWASWRPAGVITGYHAAVDPTALGLGVSALVGILQGDRGDSDRIFAALRGDAGDRGLLVRGRRGDLRGQGPGCRHAALEQAIGALNRIRGVARTRTTVVLSTRFEGRVRPAPGAGRGSRPDEDLDPLCISPPALVLSTSDRPGGARLRGASRRGRWPVTGVATGVWRRPRGKGHRRSTPSTDGAGQVHGGRLPGLVTRETCVPGLRSTSQRDLSGDVRLSRPP